MEQLFAVLRKEGFVKGTRGPGGGYRLALPASSITIAQIIRTVDEKAIDVCRDGEEYLPYVLWAELSKKIFAYLDDITLEECVNRPKLHESIKNEAVGEKSDANRVAA